MHAMALNENNRLAVFRTIAECLSLTWLLRLPYLTLVILVALVAWTGPTALGFYDPFLELAALGLPPGFGKFPFGTWLLMVLLSIVGILVFEIFWYRYLLLGPDRALRLGLSEFNGIFWRSLGYLLVLWIAMALALLPVVVFIGLVLAIEDQLGPLAAGSLTFLLVMAGLLLVLALLTRLSLVFPAVAVKEPLKLKGSWAATRGSTWRMVGALLVLYIPSFLLVYGANFGVFYAMGINMFLPQNTLAMYEHWVVTFVLSPLWYLPVALFFAVLAIAFRDLVGLDRGFSSDGEELSAP
jgi:hypothetical protein